MAQEKAAIVHWIEQGKNWINSPSRKALVGNVSALFSLRVLQRVMGLVSTYVLVRVLSQSDYGVYGYVLTVAELLAVFALPGMNNAVTQSAARGYYGTYKKAVPLSLSCSLAGVLVLVGMGIWHGLQGDYFFYIFYFAAALFPFAKGLRQWANLKAGREEFRSYSKIESIATITTYILIIAGALIFPGKVLVPVLIVLAVPGMQNIILTFSSFRTSEIRDKDAQAEEGSIAYGIKTTLWQLFGFIANRIDKILIFTFLSPASLAIFLAAERIPELSKSLLQDVGAVLAPRFAKTENYGYELERKIRLVGWASLIAMLLAALIVLPYLISFIFGEQYMEAVIYSQVMLVTVGFATSAMLRMRYISSRLDERSFRDVTVSMSLVRIAMSAVLIPLYGIAGAVISTVIYRLYVIGITGFVIRKRYLGKP
jgi:O-antigen/teichoic acid export membrane protein